MFLRRSIVLPQLNTLGTQDAEKKYAEIAGGKVVSFSSFYDEPHLRSSLRNVARFSSRKRNSTSVKEKDDIIVKIGNTFTPLEKLLTPDLVNDQEHVSL